MQTVRVIWWSAVVALLVSWAAPLVGLDRGAFPFREIAFVMVPTVVFGGLVLARLERRSQASDDAG